MFPHAGRFIAETTIQILIRKRIKSFQGPERMEAAQRGRAFVQEVPERIDGGRVLPLEDQSVRGVAVPGVGMFQKSDQLDGREPSQVGRRREAEIGWSEPVDAPAILTIAQVEPGLDVVGNRPGVLDRLAVHVENVQGSIGRIHEIHRSEPGVSRGEKFGVAVRTVGAEGHTVGFEHHAEDHVIRHFAEEQIAAVWLGIGVAAIDGHAAGGGQITGADQFTPGIRLADGRPALGPQHAPGLRRADAVNGDRVAAGGGVVQGSRCGKVGISFEVSGGKDDVLGRVADVAEEPVAPVIERVPKPRRRPRSP